MFSAGEGPWIPVRVRPDAPDDALQRLLPGATAGGTHVTGLKGALLGAHLIEDLVIPQPPVEAMVRRHLIALAARMTELDRSDGWRQRRDAALAEGAFSPSAVNAYFDMYAERLLLFGTERPFLQDPRLEEECGPPTWAARLDMSRPSGNNAWWDRRIPAEKPLIAAEATAWLVTWHGYAASGLGALRRHRLRSAQSAKAAPYRGFLNVFPHVPGNLFTTLVASVPEPRFWPDEGDTKGDYAPWENPELPDPLRPAPPQGVVSLLTARTAHAVLLIPDTAGDARKVWATWGALSDLPQATDPYLIERSERGPVRATYGSEGWRELPALLAPEATRGKITLYRPTALSTAAGLPPDVREQVGVRFIGWEQDRQERNRAWWTENMPDLMRSCQEADPEAASRVARAVGRAGVAATLLGKALGNAWTDLYPMRRREERRQLVGPAVAEFYREAGLHVVKMLHDASHYAPWRTLTLGAFDTATRTIAYAPHNLSTLARQRATLARDKEPNA